MYYTKPDDNNRPDAVFLHKTCQSVLSDVVLHEEEDERSLKVNILIQIRVELLRIISKKMA